VNRRLLVSGFVVLALALTASLAACGGGTPPLSDDAAARLHAEVTAVRSAVDARDADGARRALDTLRASVAQLRTAGKVTDERAAEILAAAGAVETRLVAITTTTTTTTTVPPPPTGKGKGDNGNGKGNGNGNQGED
jgi:hypothetical protein